MCSATGDCKQRTTWRSRPCSPPLGLRLSQTETRFVHISEGFDFVCFRTQWKPEMISELAKAPGQ